MSNTNNPARNEEQLATIPTDYRALLAMTRPLVIEEHTLPSWRGGEICRSGFGISREPRDWRADFTLKRGEIFRSDKSEVRTTEDEGRATGYEDAAPESISGLGRRDPNMQIRICLGMS
jgi:hypothetical protein